MVRAVALPDEVAHYPLHDGQGTTAKEAGDRLPPAKITGMPPREFVIRRRIAYAAGLIAKGGTPLSEVAMICGFFDSSHFCRTFKNVTGESPSAYRRRMISRSNKEADWSRWRPNDLYIREDF